MMKFSAKLIASFCLAAVIGAPLATYACTSWLVFGDLTESGSTILHKNRDSQRKRISVYFNSPKSERRWIGLGNNSSINMGINASGLAGAMNSGEKCIEPPSKKGKKNSPMIMSAILSSCDTAAQAAERLKKFISDGDYYHGASGGIFIFCDAQEGFVCEVTGKTCSIQRYDHGYTVRANIWQNPDMYALSRNTLDKYINSSGRAYAAISGLNRAIDHHGKITLLDNFDLSRHYLMPADAPTKRSLCGASTVAGGSLEIDRQYPDVLSTMYVTLGNPRTTLYIPVPICAKKLSPAISSLKITDAAWKRFDELTFSAPIPEEWSAFEKNSIAKYTEAKNQARQLLDAGKRDEAIQLLNDAAAGIWAEAAKLLGL